jgi:hypothetical protein
MTERPEMKIETLQIQELVPDPTNARQHDDKNLKAIQGSLKEFGQRKPIVITEDGVIVAGNGTVEAAKRLGWSKIDAVRIPGDWTPEMIRAFAIADNRTGELSRFDKVILTEQLVQLKEADFRLEALGFTETEVEDFSRITNASVLGSTDAFKEWAGMPEFTNENKRSAFSVMVHFPTEEDVEEFFRVINRKRAKTFWYPESDGLVGSNINEQYVVEEE